jgi:cysteine desulfurase
VTRVYLDHNATTPVSPEVADRMDQALRELWGNASSVHHFGQQAKAAVDEARSDVAALLGADSSEIIFTAGGTESDNFAIRGVAEALESAGRKHLIATSIEHEAVLRTMAALARRGWRVTLLPVDATGIVSPDALSAAITDDTALFSVMHANNEIGTIQPVAELARIAQARGVLVHTDAVQSAGKIPLDVKTLGVDMLSISAHKFYGPKGVGAMWLRKGVRLTPFLTGGRQERNRRAGTENVAGIVGMGTAARLARLKMGEEAPRVSALRNRLESGLLAGVAGAERNGAAEPRVPNTTNISFDRVESESLLIGLDLEGIAVSSGSACSSGTLEPSHVLKAMGLAHLRTLSSIRFSLGNGNTEADVDRVLKVLPPLVEKLRSLTTVGGRR